MMESLDKDAAIKVAIVVDGYHFYKVLKKHNEKIIETYYNYARLNTFWDDLCENVLQALKDNPNVSYANFKTIDLLRNPKAHVVRLPKSQYILAGASSAKAKCNGDLPKELLDSFEKSGFTTKIRPSKFYCAKCSHCQKMSPTIEQSGVDVAIAVTMLKIATNPTTKPDILIFFSGDKDFSAALKEVKKEGIEVVLAGIVNSTGKELWFGNYITNFYDVTEIICPPIEKTKAKEPPPIEPKVQPVVKENPKPTEEERVFAYYKEMPLADKEKLVKIARKAKELKTSPCRHYHSDNDVCKFTGAECYFIHDPVYQGRFVPHKVREIHREIMNKIKEAASDESAITYLNQLHNKPQQLHYSYLIYQVVYVECFHIAIQKQTLIIIQLIPLIIGSLIHPQLDLIFSTLLGLFHLQQFHYQFLHVIRRINALPLVP
eukprot:TRINITY_DN1668_c0_g1_i2.p2 TRINITY_DN1668_c0_g1~~TRINITY_DN1668_c0_g1_i2.p2  ORF type:complete len:432 (+),score=37.71 TRINITY_DN1668_c0_g1_i2:2840-4135(+)